MLVWLLTLLTKLQGIINYATTNYARSVKFEQEILRIRITISRFIKHFSKFILFRMEELTLGEYFLANDI